MKNILLLYPDMLFYKISIFNKLSTYLRQEGYNLIIWYRRIDDPNDECKFSRIDNSSMTIKIYRNVIKENKIDGVINILFKRDPGFLFYFASILQPKLSGIPIIYYGHGLNKQKDTLPGRLMHNFIHLLFDGIILYSPAEKSKIWKGLHHKITCANNTLDIEEMKIVENKKHIKIRYNINSTKIILTTGRLQSRKKIEVLSKIFLHKYKNSDDIAWVIVGSDLSDDIQEEIKDVKNIHYLGPVYDKYKMAEIFSIADIYCIPGALGLGINEALYWGLPVLTMAGKHGPEAYFLRNGINSLIAKDSLELEQMIHDILYDDQKRLLFSENAKRIFNEELTLEKMFEGFKLQLDRIYNGKSYPVFN